MWWDWPSVLELLGLEKAAWWVTRWVVAWLVMPSALRRVTLTERRSVPQLVPMTAVLSALWWAAQCLVLRLGLRSVIQMEQTMATRWAPLSVVVSSVRRLAAV
jgi:hypothetical protein